MSDKKDIIGEAMKAVERTRLEGKRILVGVARHTVMRVSGGKFITLRADGEICAIDPSEFSCRFAEEQ